MNQPRNGGIAAYLSITRGSIVSIAFASASISTHPLLWVLLPLAVVVLIATPLSPVLSKRPTRSFVVLTGISVWILTITRGPLSFFSATLWLPGISIWITVAAVVLLAMLFPVVQRNGRLPTWAWLLVTIWVVASGTASVLADPQTWIDVWALHGEAGEAWLNGQNPYSDLSVPNPMTQFPAGSIYEGYVYPPISLVTYALSDALAGDSRWFAILCGIGLVLAIRRLSRSGDTDVLGLLLLVSPGWPLMVQLSWTEVLSVLLLALAFVAKPGGRVRSVLFGLFIGSKQYLLFTALPVAVSWLRRRTRALILAGGVAAAAYAVGLVFGAGYVDWVFLFHLRVPPRPLGDNIPGLAELLLGIEIHFPSWMSILAGLALGGWTASRKPRTDASMLLAMVATMTPIFLFGYQAFPNYWYGVLGMFVIAQLVSSPNDDIEREDGLGRLGTLRVQAIRVPDSQSR